VAWCAGAGVTGTTPAQLTAEHAVFDRLLAGLAATGNQHGALFVASSAGGVYAGATAPPYSESHAVAPLSPYGHAKLGLEDSARAWGAETGLPVLLGRIANLYGPGQNLGKGQGLISQLIRAHLLRQPMSLYVPLDTVRDYLFAADCAELVAAGLDRLRAEQGVHVKVLASQQAVTIGALIGELRRIFKTSPRIVYGSSPTSHFQARDLRLRSQVWTDLDRRPVTPLPAGIKTTALALHQMLLAGELAAH
jgi:UDP-glucose 4-epimerase